jgi:predicted DNA-binding ribbon-helix-helix protein
MFWTTVKDIAADKNITLAKLVEQIDEGRKNANLSSAIRLFVLDYFMSLAARSDRRE